MPNGSSPSSGAGVEVVGLDEALRDYRRWADQLGPAVAQQSRAFAGRIAARVSSEVPHVSGALAASVHVVTVPEEGVGVSEGDGLAYAGWIEFGGSRGRPAVPTGRYLYPTALESDGEWHQLGEDVTNETIGRFPWSQAA